ncbi:MAG: multicopper oxidase domain-containing protein [Actinomycetota bacterium]
MSRDDRSVLMWGSFGVAVAALFVAIAALTGLAEGQSSESGSEAGVTVVDVQLSEFAITPAAIVVPPGKVQLRVTNTGSMVHNFSIPALEKKTSDLLGGESEILDLGDLKEGAYDALCEIAGHAASGMVATLTVTTGTGAAAAGNDGLHGFANWQEMDQAMEIRAKAFPAKTMGEKGGQLLEPVVEADGTKVFDLTVEEVDWEVEPGKIVKAKTYNGTVPGPEIRVNVGDKVKIVVTNALNESTSVHFHGIRVPNQFDGVDPYTQNPIQPGETFTYEFTTLEPAVGIYHSHHDAQVQIPDGMFGAFMVGEMPIPPSLVDKGYTKVDKEVTMVLNDSGVIGLSLNGKSFPATEPYTLRLGQVMMVHYQNEGLMGHPMHMHQPVGWIIAKDGHPLDVPMPADTIWVAPGERYTVLYKAVDPGVWAWHCHILSHAEGPQGMFGMVTALIVTP